MINNNHIQSFCFETSEISYGEPCEVLIFESNRIASGKTIRDAITALVCGYLEELLPIMAKDDDIIISHEASTVFIMRNGFTLREFSYRLVGKSS